MTGAAATALAVLAALRRGGVTDVVLSPGSRSAPLALALHRADTRGLLRLHVRIDERTAAFLALGLAKGSHRPVAVVTTSGTAVANLHPAVLEAWHVGERLLVLTADRPAALRGTGANQTTDQVSIFGPHIRSVDVPVDDAAGAVAAVDEAISSTGPTHLNLQFAEPLLPGADRAHDEADPWDEIAAAAPPEGLHRRELTPPAMDDSLRLSSRPRTVVVAGDDAGPRARLLAESAHWPLLAEPTSGARNGTHAIRAYRLLLDTPLAERIERVVVTGHPTLSRQITRLISRRDLDVIAVPGRSGVATDPGRVARHVASMPRADTPGDPGWLAEWKRADVEACTRVDEIVAEDPAALPLRIAAVVAAAVPARGLLLVGSSQPARDLDLMAAPYGVGERRLVIANRGLAGIDGAVSTAIGAALGRRSSRSLAYLGDLTFLHDANGLVIGPHEPRPDITIVVANDDGGAIFATLEQGDARFSASYERVFGTPTGVNLGALCAATGTAYHRAADAEQLRTLLTEDVSGIRVVEVAVARVDRRRLAQRIAALAAE